MTLVLVFPELTCYELTHYIVQRRHHRAHGPQVVLSPARICDREVVLTLETRGIAFLRYASILQTFARSLLLLSDESKVISMSITARVTCDETCEVREDHQLHESSL